ncbi:hypothetical protein HZS_5729 [Henneguya salminicola]|nr:hypothetical protein HZS_5729 [Henneguya salminicola]
MNTDIFHLKIIISRLGKTSINCIFAGSYTTHLSTIFIGVFSFISLIIFLSCSRSYRIFNCFSAYRILYQLQFCISFSFIFKLRTFAEFWNVSPVISFNYSYAGLVIFFWILSTLFVILDFLELYQNLYENSFPIFILGASFMCVIARKKLYYYC